MMATTGTISLEWAESGSMTATNAAAAPLADRESAFDSLRKFPFHFRCTYRLPKQITQSQVFCKIRKLTIFVDFTPFLSIANISKVSKNVNRNFRSHFRI
jgi:hypothetical protein